MCLLDMLYWKIIIKNKVVSWSGGVVDLFYFFTSTDLLFIEYQELYIYLIVSVMIFEWDLVNTTY